MSENILIGKSRKTGKWELLVDPSENYDKHLRVYQKIAQSVPQNDDYSKIIFGRIQNTSTPLTLITSEENKARLESLKEVASFAGDAGKRADERQKAMREAEQKQVQERHETALDEKNAMINNLRKASGQETFTETQTEKSRTELNERLKTQDRTRPSDVLRVLQSKKSDDQKKLDAVPKTDAEILAEKNKLVEETKKQAQQSLEQRESVEAEKQTRVDNKKQK